jgi:competence ComEA-like helix-hairpin-helix protein
MSWLTPAERRAAVVLALIFTLGAARDLWRAGRPVPSGDGPPLRTEALAPAAPASPGARVGAPPDTSRAPRPAALDLNRATLPELETLPGIGPVLAARIAARRSRAGPFRRPEDLLTVRGVGPRLLERVRPWITTSGPPEGAGGSVHSAQPDTLYRALSPSVPDPGSR